MFFGYLFLMLIGGQVYHASSFSLTITPENTHISRDPTKATVMCYADVPLTGCQFTWRANNVVLGPVLDLSKENETVPRRSQLDNEVRGYKYTGRGLAQGDCGITVDINDSKLWFVTCRVKAGDGGWKYAWAELYATNHRPLPHTRTPREAVVLPGGNATILLRSEELLKNCKYVMRDLPGLTEFFEGDEHPNRHIPAGQRYRYAGRGILSGECGLTLFNIQENDNGLNTLYSETPRPPDLEAYRYFIIIVARPPSAPSLHVVREGTNITATCKVENSRPVANITWLLGDDVIRQDSTDDSPGSVQDEWYWSWENATILQKVVIRPRVEDDGKVLKCKVTHVALPEPLVVSKRISSSGYRN